LQKRPPALTDAPQDGQSVLKPRSPLLTKPPPAREQDPKAADPNDEALATSSAPRRHGDLMARFDCFRHNRAPEAQYLHPMTPPVCCLDQAVTQRWRWAALLNEPTDEQIAICQAARDLDVGSSLKIQAFAGTGKTTTLAAIAESLAQRKFLYLVFNRVTRAREKLILSPACVEAISASADTKAGRARKQYSRGAENTVEMRGARFHRRSPESTN
jgi:hypothetical protein